MTKSDKKKRVRVNRDAVVVEYIAPEVIAPEPKVEPEEVFEPEEVSEQPLVEELSINIELDKLMDESSCLGNCEDPTSPVNSPIRKTKKPSAPKPLRNQAGDYLNPRTNRYVKVGTSAFKQLLKDKTIVEEMESITV